MTSNRIPSTEATAYPFFIIVTRSVNGRLTFLAGVWFTREEAQYHLDAKHYNYPKNALVYCASGHHSREYRFLCEDGSLPDFPAERR